MRIRLVGLALMAVLVISGCGGGGTSTGGSGLAEGGNANGEVEAEAKPGGTLSIADYAEPSQLTPATSGEIPSSHVTEQIMEPLFKADPDGKIDPWLATSMKASPDLKTFTLTLRKGVKFSNGKPLTAADVVFTLENLRKSPTWGILFEDLTKVSETSPDTVVVKAKEPIAKFEALLTPAFAAVVPKNFGGESEKEFSGHPIGTGPFEFVSWQRGSSLTLAKNPRYWRAGVPLLDKVVFKMVPDVNSRLTELHAGEVDAIASPDWSQLPSLESDPELKVGLYKAANVDLLSLNRKRPLFQNAKVREAVNLAVDREGIVKAVLYGHGETGGSFVPPGIEEQDTALKAPKQDVAKAKALLAEAVKEDGIAPKLTLNLLAGQTYTATVGQIIQADLEEAGFEVTLQPLDESAEFAQAEEGKYDMGLNFLSSVVVDPAESVGFFVATEGLFTGTETDRLAKLGSEASSATDEGERRRLYYEVQAAVNAENTNLTLVYRPVVWAMKRDVAGFKVGVTNELQLSEVGFSE